MIEECPTPIYERLAHQLRRRYGDAAGDYADARMNEMRVHGFTLKELRSVVRGARKRSPKGPPAGDDDTDDVD